MKLLKRNWLILIIMVLVAAMVLVRSVRQNSFRYDAVRWAAASADGSNLISPDQIALAGEQVLLISLGNMTEVPAQFKGQAVMISTGEILGKEKLKLIRKNRGSVILSSDDPSVSARVWMVLSEMGIKNLFVLSDQGAETP
ncbi:MAG: hypothetical protein IH593_05050 [Bacteroidales bacterium]|nr:hypothetical protein [Bacteroidales bacterium]